MLVGLEEPSLKVLPALLTPFLAQTPSFTPAPYAHSSLAREGVKTAGDETCTWYHRSHLEPRQPPL